MKDKEKQIEEILADIRKFIGYDTPYTQKKALADYLFEHYQPKLPKDSVVLSKEEYEKLKSYQDEYTKQLRDNRLFLDTIAVLETKLELKGKEMAEKFVNLPKSKILTVVYDYEEIKVVELKELQELAKQCGIEIKE